MTSDIPEALKTKLRLYAGMLCGYCHTSSHVTGQPHTIEHIVPLSRGGADKEENLWLSCRRCNEYKGAQVDRFDQETGGNVTLFNPRYEQWSDHFCWSDDGQVIIGITASGRVTVVALQMNNKEIVSARRLWVSVGWHPPANDRVQGR